MTASVEASGTSPRLDRDWSTNRGTDRTIDRGTDHGTDRSTDRSSDSTDPRGPAVASVLAPHLSRYVPAAARRELARVSEGYAERGTCRVETDARHAPPRPRPVSTISEDHGLGDRTGPAHPAGRLVRPRTGASGPLPVQYVIGV